MIPSRYEPSPIEPVDVSSLLSSVLPTGEKYDAGKPDWSLLPLGAVEEVVKVLGFGASKYAPDNWQQVPNAQRRYFAALCRHLVAHQSGERDDPETGLSHMAHVATNALFLVWFGRRGA